jgi:DNA-binding NarL/FixJ family response regulator
MLKSNKVAKITPRHALIVEDQLEFQLLLSGALVHVPGTWRVNSFSGGNEAIEFVKSKKTIIDIALIDLGLPDIEGEEVISEVRFHFPDIPILVISVISSELKIMAALRRGATGYLLKDDDAIDIATSIDQILNGDYPLSPIVTKYLVQQVHAAETIAISTLNILSNRENELLRHISAGLSYNEAAYAMKLKLSTVHAYSKTLFKKLGVHSKTGAIAAGRKLNFL